MNKMIPTDRETADFVTSAPYLTIGSHVDMTVGVSGNWLAKPDTANFLQLQALSQNIRYTIDNSLATITHGFLLAAGAIATIPVPNNGVSIFPEVSGAIIQYQWLR